MAKGYIERVDPASPEPIPDPTDKGKGVASSSRGPETEMPSHSTEYMHMKSDHALQTTEVLKQRVDEAHDKCDALMELFQAYIHKDYDEATPRQQRRNTVRVVYYIKSISTSNNQLTGIGKIIAN